MTVSIAEHQVGVEETGQVGQLGQFIVLDGVVRGYPGEPDGVVVGTIPAWFWAEAIA
jgi:hypothetical protein